MSGNTERLRLLSLLASVGELSARDGAPNDGVQLLDQETSLRWVLSSKQRPFATIASLKHHGYQGDSIEQAEADLETLVERGYVALTAMHDAYGLTPHGLAVFHGKAEFSD